MHSNSLLITTETLRSLSKSAQDEIISALLGRSVDAAASDASGLLGEDDEFLAQLSPGQVREFYSGCGDKTRKALEVIASSDRRQFRVTDIARAIGVGASELRGVWGGLTRRLYTITGESDARLINWEGHEPVFDENETYIDQVGEVSELTYQSLRKVLAR